MNGLPWWVAAPSAAVMVFAVVTAALWPYSRGWGYGPGGIVGTILVIVLILVLLGRI